MIWQLSSLWKPELLERIEYHSFEQGQEIIGPNGSTFIREITLEPSARLVVLKTSLGDVALGFESMVLTLMRDAQVATLRQGIALPTVHGKLASVRGTELLKGYVPAWRVVCEPHHLFYCGPCGVAVRDDS